MLIKASLSLLLSSSEPSRPTPSFFFGSFRSLLSQTPPAGASQAESLAAALGLPLHPVPQGHFLACQ